MKHRKASNKIETRGRKPSPYARRSVNCAFNLTPEEEAELSVIANDLGFGKSTFLRVIVQRLVRGGFSGVSFFKLGLQVSKLREQRRKAGLIPKNPSLSNDLKDAVRPLPPLDDGLDVISVGMASESELERLVKSARDRQCA